MSTIRIRRNTSTAERIFIDASSIEAIIRKALDIPMVFVAEHGSDGISFSTAASGEAEEDKSVDDVVPARTTATPRP